MEKMRKEKWERSLVFGILFMVISMSFFSLVFNQVSCETNPEDFANVTKSMNLDGSLDNLAAETGFLQLKWTIDVSHGDGFTQVGPLAVDVDDNGIYEVFAVFQGKLTCVNGETGEMIWEHIDGGIHHHAPYEIADLDNDGTYELVVANGVNTLALNAEDGTVFWRSGADSFYHHLVIADIDGTGYPYVYVCASGEHEPDGWGRISKLDGRTGNILKEINAWHPCFGGLSIADLEGDGDFELFMSDGSSENGKGLQCYDADTLELLWYHSDVWCSSHCVALVDVNDDGILDAVAMNQGPGGICVVDGSTGQKMPGKCSSSLGLPSHSDFSIYDIDGDGNLELITASGETKVWDMGSWSLDATLCDCGEPPQMADVLGDSNLEIIAPSTDGTVKIYNGQYELVETIGASAITYSCVQDIDNDGLNELILISSNGILRAYDTPAYAPTPRVRTSSLHYSERNCDAGVYVPPPEGDSVNHPPVFSDVTPGNGVTNVDIGISELSIFIQDSDGDSFDWTIETSPNIGSASVSVDSNGIKSCSISGLDYSTTYHWFVNATDGQDWTRRSYSFTTESTPVDQPPVANFVYSPTDPEVLDVIYFTDTSFDLGGTIISWWWDFGDGYFSNLQDPVHCYYTDGPYAVTLIVTDDDGMTGSISRVLGSFNLPPVAAFTWSPASPSTSHLVQFTDTSTDTDGTIVSWYWDLDETISTQQNPVYQYVNEGTYTITLTVTDDDGATDTIVQTVDVTVTTTTEMLDQEQAEYAYDFCGLYDDNRWGSQSFKPTLDTLTRVELFIGKKGDSLNDMVMFIREDIYGDDLTSVSVLADAIPTSSGWVSFDFPDVSVTPGSTYYVVMHTSNSGYSQYYKIGFGTGNPYVLGSFWYSANAGSDWVEYATYDFCFRTYGK